MNEVELQEQLIKHFHISEKFAKSASDRLSNCPNCSYINAIYEYVKSGKKKYIEIDDYNTDNLQKDFNMDYLNAVLMLVWIETDKETALLALSSGYDDIEV